MVLCSFSGVGRNAANREGGPGGDVSMASSAVRGKGAPLSDSQRLRRPGVPDGQVRDTGVARRLPGSSGGIRLWPTLTTVKPFSISDLSDCVECLQRRDAGWATKAPAATDLGGSRALAGTRGADSARGTTGGDSGEGQVGLRVFVLASSVAAKGVYCTGCYVRKLCMSSGEAQACASYWVLRSLLQARRVPAGYNSQPEEVDS
jgi:hypothetical protein